MFGLPLGAKGLGRHVEDVAEVGDEVLVAALGLARGVGYLRHRMAVAGRHLQDDVHRLDPRDVAGQVGADAEADVDLAT